MNDGETELLGYFVADMERAGPYCMISQARAFAHGDPRFIGYLAGKPDVEITLRCAARVTDLVDGRDLFLDDGKILLDLYPGQLHALLIPPS